MGLIKFLRIFIHFSFFVVLILLTESCNNKSTKELDRVDSLMLEHPDSALIYINKIDPSGFNRARKARYSLLKSQALYRNYIELSTDSVIRPALEYYANEGSDREKMFTHYYYGGILKSQENFDEAVKELEKAAEYGRKVKEDFYFPRILTLLAICYTSGYDAKDAFKPLKEAQDIFKRTGDREGMYYAEYETAQAFECTLQRDSAEVIYKKLMESEDSVYASRRLYTQYGYGLCLYKDSSYKEALELWEPYFANGPERITTFDYGVLSDLYLRDGKKEKALKMLKSMKPKSTEDSLWYLLYNELYYRHTGEPEKGAQYADSALALIRRTDVNNMENSAVASQSEKAKTDLIKKKRESRSRKTIIIVLFVLIGTIVIVSSAIIYRQLRTVKRIKREISDYIEKYRDEITQLREEIGDVAEWKETKEIIFKEVKESHEILNKFFKVMNESATDENAYVKVSEYLKNFLVHIRQHTSAENFSRLSDIELRGVLEYLSKDKDLDKEEQTIITLSLLGFSYVSIGVILEKSPNSIASKKSRIKKKLASVEIKDEEWFNKLL